MTSIELYEKLKPTFQTSAQLLPDGLTGNLSDMFSRFVRDAARCNAFNSDIYYDMRIIDDAMHSFNPDEEFEPIWVGFRKLGVDSTSFILSRIEDNNLYVSLCHNYFALYCVTVEKEDEGWYNIILSEYSV